MESCGSKMVPEIGPENSLGFSIIPYKSINDLLPHQSFAIWKDWAVFIRQKDNQLIADVVNIMSGIIIASQKLDYGDFNLPHANVCCFGPQKYSDDSVTPLLYVSQWSYSSERGVIAYDLFFDDGLLTIRPVQFILPQISSDIIGSGDIDWVIDSDRNELYAFAYKKSGPSTIEKDNEEIITCFKLPDINHGQIVYLSSEDVLKKWHYSTFNYSQDKCYYQDKIYILSGGEEKRFSHMNRLRVLNVKTGIIESVWDLTKTGAGLKEPEGLSVYNNMLLMTYLSDSSILWRCIL